MNNNFVRTFAALLIFLGFSVGAHASLSITPITWNIVGLDSNNVNVGPNNFPVGARVCNTSASATTTTVTFNWDDGQNKYTGNTYINLRSGTKDVLSLTYAGVGCQDAYFEVAVTRNASSYDKTRNYSISATDTSGTVTTPTPRQIYVEHLISQSRNAVNTMEWAPDVSGAPGTYATIAAGGTMKLAVGSTYWIRLGTSTATQGYNQLENFISFPNTLFQIISTSSTYSANSPLPPTGYVPNPNPDLYADACRWDNDPNSVNYRSCTGVNGKAGGTIVTVYQIKILSTPVAPLANPEPLTTLIYDFSGSSFHYNADFSASARYAQVVGPTLAQTFAPKTINSGGNATLTFTINNPSASPYTSVNFVDNLPAGMTVNSAAAFAYSSGCTGSPSPSTSSVGATSISFSGITVAAGATCTITVPAVTASTVQSYANTTTNLIVTSGSTVVDTGSKGSDTLTVQNTPVVTIPTSCTSPMTLATWTLENYTAATLTNSGPFTYSSKAASIAASTTATYGANGASASGIASTATGPTGWSLPSASGATGNSWGIRAGWLGSDPANPTTATTPYFQLRVDGASGYGGYGINLNYNLQGNWSNSAHWYVLTSTDGSTWTNPGTALWDKSNAWHSLSTATTTAATSSVYFRVYFAGEQTQSETAVAYIDNINVTGCPAPNPPQLTKSFSPNTSIPSTLTFTLTNPNSSALTGVSFTDNLPAGLVVNTPNGLGGTCTGGTYAAAAGGTSIIVSGQSLAASASCTVTVSVSGTVPGTYRNVTTNIASTETGANATSTGVGTADLTIPAVPPVIAKVFGPASIITSNTTTLSFSIYNPNSSTALAGVAFTDTLPVGLEVGTATTSVCGGTNNLVTNAGARTIVLSGVSLAAGASCTLSVTVTGSSAGTYTNTTTVASTTAGAGNTATASLNVRASVTAISLNKQVGLSSDLNGTWNSNLTVGAGTPVYYQFTLENKGDTSLTLASNTVVDATLATALGGPVSCTWYKFSALGPPVTYVTTTTLPAASGGDPIAYCVAGPVSFSTAGTVTNTATATTGSASASDSSVLTVLANPTISNAFTVSDLASGGSTNLTIRSATRTRWPSA